MSIVKDYLKITKDYKNEYGEKTIVLMEVGSFYEVYALINPDGSYTGSDIEEFAKMNDMVIAKKNITVNDCVVAMAGVGTAYADKYIQKLQEHGFTIVIYTQDVSKKNTTRSLSEIISPGTFFPSETEYLSNNIMCIWIQKINQVRKMSSQVSVGISNIDIFTGKTSLFQFTEKYNHNPSTYDELERYVSTYKPSECVFIANLPDNIINEIIMFVGLENTKIHKFNTDVDSQTQTQTQTQTQNKNLKEIKNVEKQVYQMEIIKRFYPNLSSIYEMFPTHYMAVQSFCYLLDFVYRHNPNLSKKLSEPVFENYTDRLILSNHTLSQLNITDDTRHTGKLRSVSSLLNNCVTTMGKRQFLYNLHYPITKEKELNDSYDITHYLLTKGVDYNQQFRNKLSSISDLERFMRKMVTQKIAPKNLSSLVEDLTNIETLNKLNQEDELLSEYLSSKDLIGKDDYLKIKTYCREIITDITNVFSIEECSQVSDINTSDSSKIIGIVNKGISQTIDELYKKSIEGRDKLEALCDYFSNILQQYEKTTTNAKKAATSFIKIHETAKSNPSLIGTSRRVGLLKTAITKQLNQIATIPYKSNYSGKEENFTLNLSEIEYTTGAGSKTDMVVTSKEIIKIINESENAKERLIKEIQMLFNKYVNDFSKYERELYKIIHYTTELDMLQCKTYIAHKYNYCKPVILESNTNKSYLSFTGIRHPLIEHLQTNELYVTNDLTLGVEEKENENDSTNGILLYGTNAVGKTSFIRSVGISVVMAQAGLFVPCETFTYKPYRNIFTRILGNDNLFKGLSTFAVEMTELRTILTMANEHSLILGDELCSGTESDSALSIFTAGLEVLHEKESTFLFATHFHEIVNYDEIKALSKLKMMHMAVHYNKELNTLVYDRKLREGSGESMYGLEVCKSLNLPDTFLERAHDIRMKYNPTSKNILSHTSSHFNAKKIMTDCEICKKNKASEVHHLQHQKNASPENNNHIKNKNKQSFHKNHLANLINICEKCHNDIHKTDQEHKVVKTTDGYRIMPL
jgi:DNA mismatch repair protein MutS